MNWDRIEGNWKQVTGKLQERYGVAKDEAEKQLADWERKATDSLSLIHISDPTRPY